MARGRRPAWWGVVLVVLCAWLGQCHGQGTLVPITFDGPPEFGRVQNFYTYSESGMLFAAILDERGYGGFGRINRWRVEGYPYNGTAYIQTCCNYPVEITSTSGLPFGLVSVDVAEAASYWPYPATVPFIGYRADGSSVSTNFTTDGIIDVPGRPDFQTFYFGPEFSQLTRVRLPGYSASLDNLWVYIIPEPSVGGLLVLGGLLILWRQRFHSSW
jgi:hypothetical protein